MTLGRIQVSDSQWRQERQYLGRWRQKIGTNAIVFLCQGQSGPGSCGVRGRKRFLDDAAKQITARLEYEKEQWLYIMIPPRSLVVHSNHYIHVLNVLPAAAETSRNNISSKKVSMIILGIKHSKAERTHILHLTATYPACCLPHQMFGLQMVPWRFHRTSPGQLNLSSFCSNLCGRSAALTEMGRERGQCLDSGAADRLRDLWFGGQVMCLTGVCMSMS